MQHPCRLVCSVVFFVIAVSTFARAADEKKWLSYPPVRPLPTPSTRPANEGPGLYVDPAKGNDAADGSLANPWKTLKHSLSKLKRGDTLYLRGGTYYESVNLRLNQGSNKQSIVIRSYPGELAIIDAGIREFFENPATAWEPVSGGAPDEYRSTKSYEFGGGFGNFGDSMVPFHRYMNFHDLRSSNELFKESLSNRTDDPEGIYCGPGTLRDPETGRIHIRLSQTKLAGLRDSAYKGETDPRKLPLVIAGKEYGIVFDSAQHLKIQDIVIRGGQHGAVRMIDAGPLEMEGCTFYGSNTALRTSETRNVTFTNCSFRGHAAPWHSRFSHKNRSGSGYLVSIAGSNLEFAHCEITDHHDGMAIERTDGLKIHHCFISNFNDDGIEPGRRKQAGVTEIYCNYISKCQSPFSVHGKKAEQIETIPGSGVYLYRNIIDMREGNYYGPPSQPDPTGAYLNHTTNIMLHDHGSPTQQNYYVYQNTFIMPNTAWRSHYAFGWGGRTRYTHRRTFNNICVQVDGVPGTVFTPEAVENDVQVDGNLHWGVNAGPEHKGDIFAKFRNSELFKKSQQKYPAGFTAHDVFADPKFVEFYQDPRQPSDLRLQPDSPAVNAGVAVPPAWNDPMREKDAGQPDIGALPANAEPWRVGVQGRMSAFGY